MIHTAGIPHGIDTLFHAHNQLPQLFKAQAVPVADPGKTIVRSKSFYLVNHVYCAQIEGTLAVQAVKEAVEGSHKRVQTGYHIAYHLEFQLSGLLRNCLSLGSGEGVGNAGLFEFLNLVHGAAGLVKAFGDTAYFC